MSDILDQKYVKTRKPHKCWGCGKEIPKGSKVTFTKSVDCGEITSCYWCETCDSLWNYNDVLDLDCSEGIGFGEFNDLAEYFVDEENVEKLLDYCKEKRELKLEKRKEDNV